MRRTAYVVFEAWRTFDVEVDADGTVDEAILRSDILRETGADHTDILQVNVDDDEEE